MTTPLETTIERLTGQRLSPPPMPYLEPHQVQTYLVCPHCRYIPTFYIQRQQWECHQCQQAVTPIKSAVCNQWPYVAETESA
jgi:hypothetical protein